MFHVYHPLQTDNIEECFALNIDYQYFKIFQQLDYLDYQVINKNALSKHYMISKMA